MTTFGEGFIKVRPETSGFAAETDSKIGGALKSVAKIAAGALAIGGTAEFLKGAIENAEQFQERMAAVDAQLKTSGQGTEKAQKTAENYTDALSKLSSFSKTEVATALQRAELGTHNLGKSMQVETIAANLARKSHMDLTQTTVLVTKAFAGNTTGLKRLGVSFVPVTAATDALKVKIAALSKEADGQTGATKKQTEEQIKLVKSQLDAAKATDKAATGLKVQKTLADLAAGGIKAFSETTAGKMAAAQNAVHDLEIEVGTALLPVIGKLATFASEQITKLNEHWPEIKKQVDDVVTEVEADFKRLKPAFDFIEGLVKMLVGDLGGIGQTVKDIGIAIAAFVVITKTIQVATALYEALAGAIFLATHAQEALDVAMEANPIGLVIVAIAALAAGLYIAYQRSATFRQIVNATFADLKTAANASIRFVTQTLLPDLEQGFDKVEGVVRALLPIFTTIFNGVKSIVTTDLHIVIQLFEGFNDLIHGRWSDAWNDVKSIPKELLDELVTVITTELSVLEQTVGVLGLKVAHALVNAIKQAPAFLVGLAGDLGTKIEQVASQVAGEAFNDAKQIGVQIVKGVVAGIKSLPGEVASAVAGLIPGGGGNKTPIGPGGGRANPKVTGGGTGTTNSVFSADAFLQGDGSFGPEGFLKRQGGKWFLNAGDFAKGVQVPLKADISGFLKGFSGRGLSPAMTKELASWWKDHFSAGKVHTDAGGTLALAGQQVARDLYSGINNATKTLGSSFTQSLSNQLLASIKQAKQNLSSISSGLGQQIGQIIDSQLAGTDIGGTTVGAASAKIAADQVAQQTRQLQSTVDAAKAAAAAGPGATDAKGNPLTPDAVAKAQGDLDQAVKDAQDNLDDYLLQNKIQAASDAQAVAKQSVNDQIALWTYQFNQGILSQQDYLADINGLAGQYTDAGGALGGAFVGGFTAQLAALVSQVQAITTSGPAGAGGNGLGPDVVNPSDDVISQLIAATGQVGTDKTSVGDATRALAAAQNADARARVANFNDGHQTAATKKAQAAADKALEAAEQQLKTAQASETKDTLIVQTLRALLVQAGLNPDQLIAAAAR